MEIDIEDASQLANEISSFFKKKRNEKDHSKQEQF